MWPHVTLRTSSSSQKHTRGTDKYLCDYEKQTAGRIKLMNFVWAREWMMNQRTVSHWVSYIRETEKSLPSSFHKENKHCFESFLLTAALWKKDSAPPNLYFDKGTKGGKIGIKKKERTKKNNNNVMDKPISFLSVCRPSTHTQELKKLQREAKRRIVGGVYCTVFLFSQGFVEFQSDCVHTCIISVLIKEEGWVCSEEFKCSRPPAGTR